MACHAGDRRSFYTASVDAVYRAPSCTLDVGAIPHLPQSSHCAPTSLSLSAIPVPNHAQFSPARISTACSSSLITAGTEAVLHTSRGCLSIKPNFSSRDNAPMRRTVKKLHAGQRERERERETARQVKESADAATGLSRYSAIQGSKCESRRVSDPASIQRGRLDGQAGQTMCCIVYIPTCAVPQKRHFRLAITTTRHMHM